MSLRMGHGTAGDPAAADEAIATDRAGTGVRPGEPGATTAYEPGAAPAGELGTTAVAGRRTSRLVRVVGHPATVAVTTWLVAVPAAFAAAKLADLSPFAQRSWSLLLVAAMAGIGTLLAVWAWRDWPALPGLAAGLAAGWVALVLRVAQHGTPFGFGGLQGDAGRMAAMATRYSAGVVPTDAWVPGIPAEYPPLYAWLVGRAAALTGIPAWQLLADAQVVVLSAAVVAAFLLWRRLVPAWVAVAISGLLVLVTGDPRKAYEVLALFVFVPWVLATFGRPPRGRLHWLPAGIIGGLFCLTYQGWLVFGSLAIVAVMVVTYRAAEDRRGYLRHLAGVAAVAVLVAAWYLVPYGYGLLTHEGKLVSDLYVPGSLNLNTLPFLSVTPLGLLQLTGLAGMVWLRRSTWWALPLLLITAGTFLFRLVAMTRFVVTGHTTFFHYSAALYGAALAVAGVLTLVHVGPVLARRLGTVPPRGVGAAALAVSLAATGYLYSWDWTPAGGGPLSHFAVEAHREPLPDGGYPRYSPAGERTPWFPVGPIQRAVESVTGPDPHQVTLSPDERLYAYLPWAGYIGTSRLSSNSMVRWDERVAELRRIAAITEPGAFAQASADTAFGPIDVFILNKADSGWMWRNVRFGPAQFDAAHWVVFDQLPQDVVVAVRR